MPSCILRSIYFPAENWAFSSWPHEPHNLVKWSRGLHVCGCLTLQSFPWWAWQYKGTPYQGVKVTVES